MAKFNRPDGPTHWVASKHAAGPINTTTSSGLARTHEGAPAYARDARGELFMLAVSNMVGEDTFYEGATARDQRYRDLIREIALVDPRWIAQFTGWLRTTANMRSASVVMAAELAYAYTQRRRTAEGMFSPTADEVADLRDGLAWHQRDFTAKGPIREAIAAACQRADEPGEFLAYWRDRGYGPLTSVVKRGLGDAVVARYNQASFYRYDSNTAPYRFGKVIELIHPKPRDEQQSDLFRYAVEVRHNRYLDPPRTLGLLRNSLEVLATLRAGILGDDLAQLAEALDGTVLSWEKVMSEVGGKADKRQLWEALVPKMGTMAVLRNLRNLEQAGVGDDTIELVNNRLQSEDEIANSRQFPYRFMAAYRNVVGDTFKAALSRAADLSLRNVPVLEGRTLVLIDTSGSMQSPMSARSTMSRVDAAALFGLALAARNPGDVQLYGFANGDDPFQHQFPPGGSLLSEVERFRRRIGDDGHGTMIAKSLQRTLRPGHNRVIIITDEQTWNRDHRRHGNLGEIVPEAVPLFTFNVSGYAPAVMETTRNRFALGGLTDVTFRLLPLLEAGLGASWPWEQA